MNNQKTILLITRCCRLEHLDEIYKSILSVAGNCVDAEFVWAIGIDKSYINDNRLNLLNREYFNNISNVPGNLNIQITLHTSNQAMYGANIANEIVNSFAMGKNYIQLCNTYCYLLDDDNALHLNFTKVIELLSNNITLHFNQLRAYGTEDYDSVYKSDNLSIHNSVGYIDSAQFIIPLNVLLNIGLYTLGYFIDGETIKRLLVSNYSTGYIDITAAFYNGCVDF